MAPLSRANRLHYVVATVWVVTTVSLASWWIEMGIASTGLRRMYAWEGASFITLLVGGGIAMVIAIRREHQRRGALETFFMSFTHDLKTSLASIQLQAEGLREDWPAAAGHGPLDRLLHDTVRLQIQLENSLFVAQPDGRLLREHIDVAKAITRLLQDWPELTLRATGNAVALADARAFDIVFRNLLQNAVVHGHAHAVDLRVIKGHDGTVHVQLIDDGRGVPASQLPRLGHAVAEPGDTNGTGVGLFVSAQLISRMGGRMTFGAPAHAGGQGFVVDVFLPGAH
jgi:signal transduction histidine kinase